MNHTRVRLVPSGVNIGVVIMRIDDSLREADIVNVNGRRVRIAADQYGELTWSDGYDVLRTRKGTFALRAPDPGDRVAYFTKGRCADDPSKLFASVWCYEADIPEQIRAQLFDYPESPAAP